MKRITILIVLASLSVFSQKFSGIAKYVSDSKYTISTSTSVKSSRVEGSEKVMHIKKTYKLVFDNKTSLFVQEKTLDQPSVSGMKMFSSVNKSKLYKDLSSKTYLNQKNVMGQDFLISDVLEQSNWKLTTETKKIGNYTCYKAISKKEVEKKSFILTDGKNKGTKKMVTIETTAWYTPQIPVSNGPELHGGLPGLILEVSEGEFKLLCTEIVLNPKKKIKIKKPTKGKRVTAKEYKDISHKRLSEMLARFKTKKGRKGKKGSKRVSIQISE